MGYSAHLALLLVISMCVCSMFNIPIYAIAEDQYIEYIERDLSPSLLRIFDIPENRRNNALRVMLLLRLLAGQTNL